MFELSSPTCITPTIAMVGVIQVGDDNSNIETAKNVATQFKSSFVMNQTRLDEYLSKIN